MMIKLNNTIIMERFLAQYFRVTQVLRTSGNYHSGKFLLLSSLLFMKESKLKIWDLSVNIPVTSLPLTSGWLNLADSSSKLCIKSALSSSFPLLMPSPGPLNFSNLASTLPWPPDSPDHQPWHLIATLLLCVSSLPSRFPSCPCFTHSKEALLLSESLCFDPPCFCRLAPSICLECPAPLCLTHC